MANILNDLVQPIYQSLEKVQRESTGLINALQINGAASGLKIGQEIIVPVTGVANLEDIVPAMTPPRGADINVSNVRMALETMKKVTFHFEGEDLINLNQRESIIQNTLAQAFRKLRNSIEASVIAKIVGNANVTGIDPTGTNPFESSENGIKDFVQIDEFARENGLTEEQMHLVATTKHLSAIKANMSVLYEANRAGTDQLLREGTVGRVFGTNIHDSQGFNGGVDSIALALDSVALLARTPANTDHDVAADRTVVLDASGLPFEVSLYEGYRMYSVEIACAWGSQVLFPDRVALVKDTV